MKRAHVVLCLGVLTGCAGLIGVPDLTFDEQAGQGNAEGGANDGAAGDAPPTNEGGPATCDESKLQTDPSNCGRCGHDCLGGACNAGKCESVLVKGGLENPVDLVTDAMNVYVTARGNGAVLRIAKDGSKTDVLASGHSEARGVTLDGQNLYWSNLDFAGDGGDDRWGGVWGCTLPACSNTHLVTTADRPANVRFSGGFLYFAETNNGVVVRVKPDGSMRSDVGTGNQPFSVAVDGTHVYFQANRNDLQRSLLDGGTQENVGPLEYGGALGFVTVDDERVYWAFSEFATPTGHVYSALKATPAAPKEQYGTANKGSIGVAVDATTLYWTNEGTFDGNDTSLKDGQVLACPKAGCGAAAPVVLADAMTTPGAIAVDDSAVYFLLFGSKRGSADGELRKIAKP
ncbi:MAG: hypothetical protein KF764_32395 [Labilithrix sp.]|nr:hypothetical protein [Labilithrix sp.]